MKNYINRQSMVVAGILCIGIVGLISSPSYGQMPGFCGDGYCDALSGEDTISCPLDCSLPPPPPPGPVCGNFICEPLEEFTCPQDCGSSLDTDKDGMVARDDNCPTVYNPTQKDFDYDGKGDACDPPNRDNCDQTMYIFASVCPQSARYISKWKQQCYGAIGQLDKGGCSGGLAQLKQVQLESVRVCGLDLQAAPVCALQHAFLQGMIDYLQDQSNHHCCPFGMDSCGGGNTCSTSYLTDLNNCGGCGIKCPSVKNAVAACTSGVCGYSSCTPGHLDLDGDASNGCGYSCGNQTGSLEICFDGIDNNCNGTVDEGCNFPPPPPF